MQIGKFSENLLGVTLSWHKTYFKYCIVLEKTANLEKLLNKYTMVIQKALCHHTKRVQLGLYCKNKQILQKPVMLCMLFK